jgi:acetyl-CoA carboxylase carboxyl transferase subunit alpha
MGFRSNDLDNAPSKKRRYLEFETSLSELDAQITQLKGLKFEGRVDVSNEIKTLEQKSEKLLKEIFSNLTAYQKVQLSRHPDRPSTLDYIGMIFDDFMEFHGDRNFMDDRSIVGGLATEMISTQRR